MLKSAQDAQLRHLVVAVRRAAKTVAAAAAVTGGVAGRYLRDTWE